MSPACEWTDASIAFTLYLNPTLMVRLGIESWTAFKQVPRRGLEIGGILLGRGEAEQDSVRLWIDGYRTVESEHRWGPSYLLSDTDFEHLREDVQGCGTAALGLFRTHTRSPEVAVETRDSELLARAFDGAPGLLLVLGPAAGKAAVFARVQGELKCVYECPVLSSLAGMLTLRQSHPAAQTGAHLETGRRIAKVIGAPEPYASGAIAVPEASGPPAAPPVAAPRPPRAPALSRSSAIAAGIALLAAGAIAGGIAGSLHHGLPEPSFLRLTVQPAGSSLRLSWDPSSPALEGAVRAVLHIDDGDQQNERTLSVAELKKGAANYAPQSGSVTFRLDVYPAAPRSFGTIQVLRFSPVPLAKTAQAITTDHAPPEDHPEQEDPPARQPAPAPQPPKIIAAQTGSDLRGISVAPLSPVLRQRFHLHAGDPGVIVTAVQPASPAFEAVLQEGDIIQEVDRKPVSGVAELDQAMRKAARSAVLLSVDRGGVRSFHAVP